MMTLDFIFYKIDKYLGFWYHGHDYNEDFDINNHDIVTWMPLCDLDAVTSRYIRRLTSPTSCLLHC
jgi:hypothetical protein